MLHLCGSNSTLIYDADAVYDLMHLNDRLVLGLKGTLSEVELFTIRARLQSGALSKAARGELRIKLPIGYVYSPSGQVELDPDRQVQQTIRLFFEVLRRLGSAKGVVRHFNREGMTFPVRPIKGPDKGELTWRSLSNNLSPAIANERLSTNERGQVVYRFKQPFRDGTTHVVLDPLDCIARLAALVPRPRLNLTRFHGVFAPNCKLREHIVPRHQPTAKAPDKPLAPMTWMQRLKRVYSIDIETCPKCGGKLRVIACIEDPDIIARILEHIRTRDESQPSQPRAPPLRTELPTSVHQDRLF